MARALFRTDYTAQPARSRYNSPIFAVMKKVGNVRLVQDFRALNNASFRDPFLRKGNSVETEETISTCTRRVQRACKYKDV